MANPLWTLNLKLQGESARNRTNMTFVIQYDDAETPLTLAGAQSAADQIIASLDDVSDAVIAKASLTYLVAQSDLLAADEVDAFEEAVVMCHLNEAGDLPELYALRIPAPVDGLFLADKETVDIGNADLVQYVQQVAQHAFVSDGEQIQTGTGTNGMSHGHKRQRPKSYAR